MLTNLETSIILKLFLEEKINCKKDDIKFKSRCFTGGGWYLYFDTNFDKIFISRTINIDYLNDTGFYFSFTLFGQDIDNFYLQATVTPIKDLNQTFSEDIFLLNKRYKFDDVMLWSMNLVAILPGVSDSFLSALIKLK